MDPKKFTTMFMIIGGVIGGYIPLLWGANYFSFASILFNALGAIFGVWLAFKITR
jgi:hypothetical protein